MLINIVGWYGERNTGDDSFRMIFDRLFLGHEVVYTQRPLEKADRIVYGGGGVLGGAYLEGLGDRPAYALGVDIPLSGPNYERLRELNFKKIVQRSFEYQGHAERQGWDVVSFAPDIAFGLPLIRIEADRSRVALSLTHELKEEKIGEVVKFVDWLCMAGKRPTFIAMYEGKVGPDTAVIAEVMKRSEHCQEAAVWNCSEEPLIVRQMIGRCSSIVSMRFHGSIFAAGLGRPFVSLANPGKHSLFCAQEGMPERFVDLRSFTFESLKDVYEQTNDPINIAAQNYKVLTEQVFPSFVVSVLFGL